MATPILVTGAAGFAGSHLLDRLTADRPVVAWHRNGAPPSSGAHVAWQKVDVLDRISVADAIARVRPTTVYHCAGAAHVGRAWDDTTPTFEVNVLGTHHLLEALRRAGANAVVLIPSSAMVYRPSASPLAEDAALVPPNPYGLSKLAQELLASHASLDGLDIRIARSFNHVGPRQAPAFAASGFARQIAEIEAARRPPEIVVGNLDAEREATDVRDTVRAYEAIAERGPKRSVYNVCSGTPYRVGDILERLVARSRARVSIRVDPARLRPNDIPRLIGDPSRIERDLHWKPAIPLDQTLDDLLGYWRTVLSV